MTQVGGTIETAGLSRPPTLAQCLGSPALNNFNLLRLLAAIAVVFGHSFALSLNLAGAVEPVPRLLKFAYSGSIAVDVFFLISGIFVSQSFYFEPNAASFAMKRFFRIWPGLVVCLVASVFLAAAVSPGLRHLIFSDPATYSYVLRNSVLDMQWGIPLVFEGRPRTAINGSLWTLPVEARMYVCVLVVGVLGFLRSRLSLSLFAVAAAILMLAFPEKFTGFLNLNDKETIVPVIFFLAGMAIFAQRNTVSIRWGHVLCLLVLAALTGFPTLEFIVYVLIGLCTLWFGCSRLLARLPKLPGDYSYGVYIYAFPIQQAVASIWPAAGPYQMFAVAMLAVLPCAIVSWHLVELPAQIAGKSMAHAISGAARADGGFLPVLRRSWRGVALPAAFTLIAIIGGSVASQQLDARAAIPLQAQIIAFGPTPVVHGQPFNQQPDGKSAIWVKLNHPAERDFTLVLAGQPLATVVNGDLLTANVPAELLNSPGVPQLWVEAVRQARRARSKPVTFVVQ